jgi:hypothetical protein
VVSRTSASKLGVRGLVGLALASVALAGGCYSTTPHRAQFATQATPKACSAAIGDFFANVGFVQLPTPPRLSMLFTARVSGPYTSFLRTGTGIGVTVNEGGPAIETCSITLEALSPDISCTDLNTSPTCVGPPGAVSRDPISGTTSPTELRGNSVSPCPIVAPVTCELSYAPGDDNDAAVDALARRLQAALGPGTRVN